MMSHFLQAIMRRPGENAGFGLTTAKLGEVDTDKLTRQHAAYADVLRNLGVRVEILPPLDSCPDAYFVEDAAIVTRDVAIITRPGAEARRQEAGELETVLASYRKLGHIEEPATLDGGDVLIIGKTCFVGVSERTNGCGFAQIRDILAPFGYTCIALPVSAGLHLKSGVNAAGPDTLVVAPDWAQRTELSHFRQIVLDEDEAYAANVLWINDHLLVPAGFPKTREKVEALGVPIIELDMSEPRKMDGGLTCLSLRF